MIPFFLGIGIRKLSVAPRLIGLTTRTVSNYDHAEAKSHSMRLLGIRNLREMEEFVSEFRAPDAGQAVQA